MLFRRHLCLIVLLLAWAFFLASPAYAEDCLLYASTLENTLGLVMRMDEQANLSLAKTLTISEDTFNIAVSRNGRVVVFAGNHFHPNLALCFIRDDGSISDPLYLDNPHGTKDGWNPYHATTFHASLPLFYTGWQPLTTIFRYDPWRETAEPTGWAANIYAASENYCYSSYAGCLICQAYVNPGYGLDGVRSVRINADGSFGEIFPALALPSDCEGFCLSPDGRWAVGVGYTSQELKVVAVGQDGWLTLAENLVFGEHELNIWNSMGFSPDGSRLYLLNWGKTTLYCFAFDRQTGKLQKLSGLVNEKGQVFGSAPRSLAISPDGRFAAFRCESLLTPGEYDLNLVRLYEDGRMEYLPEKTVTTNAPLNALAFGPIPPPLVNAAAPGWGLYE